MKTNALTCRRQDLLGPKPHDGNDPKKKREMNVATAYTPGTHRTDMCCARAEKEHPMVNAVKTRLAGHTVAGRNISSALQTAGVYLIRYGLVLIVAWIGAMKFTAYEAHQIQPLVANSPLMGWVYHVLSIQAFSNVLGVAEIAIAMMIALRPLSAVVAAVGSGAAVAMFLTTLSFLVSTPGWEPSLGGFPALAVVPGQFLVKDVVLLGAALWSLGEALPQNEHGR
jgi:uncharacterized membrane protein YkgB